MKFSTDIIMLGIDEVIPYERNAKIHKDNVALIANSIKQFGFKQPILIDKNYVIIAGHGRLAASKSLSLSEVPCIIADDLTETQVKALRLADNKVSESGYDDSILQAELEALVESDYDMADFGFTISDLEDDDEEPYSTKIDIPQYELKGEQPELEDLVDMSKYDALCKDIEASSISEDIKDFLKLGAMRHVVFRYDKIAEYYAHTDPQSQKLFEDSILVIIDLEDAIRNGYTTLESQIADLVGLDDDQSE